MQDRKFDNYTGFCPCPDSGTFFVSSFRMTDNRQTFLVLLNISNKLVEGLLKHIWLYVYIRIVTFFDIGFTIYFRFLISRGQCDL